MRRFSHPEGVALDEFVDGTSFDLVVALYEFDERLRHSVFAELDRVEMAVRAMLRHELRRINLLIHLEPHRPGSRAYQRRNGGKDGRSVHDV